MDRTFTKSITVRVTEYPKPRQATKTWNFGTWHATNRDDGFSYEPVISTSQTNPNNGSGTCLAIIFSAAEGVVTSAVNDAVDGYPIKETAFTVTCWRRDLVQAAVAYLATLGGEAHTLSAALAALEAVAVNQGWWGTPADLGEEAAR